MFSTCSTCCEVVCIAIDSIPVGATLVCVYFCNLPLLSEVAELLSVALRAVLALAAIAFCLFSSVVQVTFIIFYRTSIVHY